VSSYVSLISRPRVAIFTFFIFIITIALILPSQSANLREEIGDNPTPDLSTFYTVEELYNWAELYGESGRISYIRTRFTFDIIWPIIYTGFLVSSIGSVTHGRYSESTAKKLVLIPVLGLLFDYLENISTSIIMWRYPIRTPIIDYAATLFTPLKWMFLGSSFLILLICMLNIFYQFLKQNTS
jgi:hypothetical protein